MSITSRRVWLLINILVTAALLPALFSSPDDGSDTAVAAGAGVTEARPLSAVASPPATVAMPTTTTTAPPSPSTTAASPPPTVKPAAAPTTTTTRPRPTTTTTVAAQTAPPPASGSESGRATWYDYRPGICAHKTLPFGTVVTVNAVNGKSVQCTVGDRGPFVDGYVIDLHWQEFEQLAPRSTGRIDVTITW